MTASRATVCVLCVALSGCSRPAHGPADAEKAREALVAALDAWKSNAPQPSRPVVFSEELRKTQRLVEYAVGEPDLSDAAVVRFPVTLSLMAGRGKTSERKVVFAVKLGEPPAVSRDPYY